MAEPKARPLSQRVESYGCGGWRPLVKPLSESWWLQLPQDGFTAEAEAHSIKAHTRPTILNGRNVEERRERKLNEPRTTLDGAATLGNYD